MQGVVSGMHLSHSCVNNDEYNLVKMRNIRFAVLFEDVAYMYKGSRRYSCAISNRLTWLADLMARGTNDINM